MIEGLIDTNVFVHAHTNDQHSDESRRFLAALEAGRVRAVLTPLVLHELSYALPHYVQQMTRAEVADYLLTVLAWDGVVGDKGAMADAVERWRDTPGLSFTDAYLSALARESGCPGYSKNAREFRHQGVDVPDPLPV